MKNNCYKVIYNYHKYFGKSKMKKMNSKTQIPEGEIKSRQRNDRNSAAGRAIFYCSAKI